MSLMEVADALCRTSVLIQTPAYSNLRIQMAHLFGMWHIWLS